MSFPPTGPPKRGEPEPPVPEVDWGDGLQPQRVVTARVMRPRPPPPDNRALKTGLALAGAAVAVAAIGLATWAFYPRPPTPEDNALDTASADNDPADAGLARADASRLQVQAKIEALAWDRDATLALIRAEGVVGGLIDLENGGNIEFHYAKPRGAKLGPGAPLDKTFLVVSFPEGKPKKREQDAEAKALGVAEPGCPLSLAWRKMVASGVPSSERLTLVYTHSEKHDRAVWRIDAQDDPKLNRTLGGATCNVLTR